jgi:hypothetical protein
MIWSDVFINGLRKYSEISDITRGLQVLKLKHRIHSAFEKSLFEPTMQYVKDRMESFDDYFPCK